MDQSQNQPYSTYQDNGEAARTFGLVCGDTTGDTLGHELSHMFGAGHNEANNVATTGSAFGSRLNRTDGSPAGLHTIMA